jgi:hypothetical protein
MGISTDERKMKEEIKILEIWTSSKDGWWWGVEQFKETLVSRA